MAVLWSAPEAIGNILHILTQLILCLDFYLLSILHFKIQYSDCREEGVQHQVRCVELRRDHVGDHELRGQGDDQHLYCIV